MLLQLKKLILWPRHVEEEPRILDFKPGAVNVITGASKTGKSAIIPIIDYCLGSDRCAIPVKTIRDSCEWFGILVQTEAGERLLARREPGNQKSTGDMYVLEGKTIAIPRTIEKNATVEVVKQSFNELAGLTQLEFEPDSLEGGSWGRPSFRDMVSFMFQPQNVIANPDVLFFKTDTHDYREKLKEIFPYVLNAVNPEMLGKQHELRMLRRELMRKERELAGIRRVSDRWIAEVEGKISTAREFGLLARETSVPNDLPGRIDVLRRLAVQTDVEGRISLESVSDAASELVGLQKEEEGLSTELSHLRHRYSEMTRLKEVAEHHREAVGIKRDRLRISEWFRGLHEESSECPVCGNKLAQPEAEIQKLVEALRTSEAQAGENATIPAAFDREYQRIKDDIARATERLAAVSIRRRALERQSRQIAQEQYQARAVWRFLGELGESITRFESIQGDGALAQEVESLQNQIAILESELRRSQIERRIDDALRRVSVFAGRLLPKLDNERPEDPITLSIKDLTITVSGDGRSDSLWEIGSGANWLSYHLAVILALHRLFLSFPSSPVPGLLVFDQPSQVYFPRKAGVTGDEGFDPEFTDEDILAVRKIFEVLASEVRESRERLQTVVLDHASESVWGRVEGVHLVEEWREGDKLVPRSWIK